ncbi:molybdopterin-dependent oxidoreductase [Microbacteriaceae bacterium VKM Ac-2855]|nr:molybdopterin-dependent oxidoreductase [Microbacteriaceae bacterium VKM Ac-2855]
MQRVLHQASRSLRAPSRTPRTAVVIGRLLGLAFLLCFGTGLYSHFLQEPLPWMQFVTRPVSLYQVTQGLHVTAGIVCFPLILAKLYAVFPALFQTPPVRSLAHLVERASIAVFVAASLVQITIGLLNTYQFYSLFPFSFRNTHWMLSFIVVGSLAIHIGVKLPIIARHWNRPQPGDPSVDEPTADAIDEVALDGPDEYQRLTGRPETAGVTGRIFAWIDREPAPAGADPRVGVSRRAFMATVAITAAAVVALTAGQSFRLFDRLNLFGPRRSGIGPQALPVNRTAQAAEVVEAASSPNWSLTLTNGGVSKALDAAQLRALPQYEVRLPIACVEGWSQNANWRGPRLKDLLALVDAPQDAMVRIVSLQTNSMYGRTSMTPEFIRDDLTLVALDLEGDPLDLDHGYPARIIAPARPGVLQTKWLSEIVVLP